MGGCEYLPDVICVSVGMCVCVIFGPLCVCLASGIYVGVGVNVFLMVFVGEWVCVDVRVCVCVSASSCSVWYQSNCGESEETNVLLPCSCCCIVLSECAVILGPNVCACV